MSTKLLRSLSNFHHQGASIGLPSICSAHPDVIRAALSLGRETQQPVLIEATCNQVNQDGGYTGMTPAGFRRFVETIADETGYDRSGLILGGDHLGPNPWKNLPTEQAFDKARAMVSAFAAAGFEKIHLDCSMGCAGEPLALDDEMTAARAADLCSVAESHSSREAVYIIGTEVPVPGGALEEVEHVRITSPEAALTTVEVHRHAFAKRDLQNAFNRVIGLVVQPGVEFGNQNVVAYMPDAARTLSQSLAQMPDLVFEAHSTDYQSLEALRALVQDGFSVLKVGPGLTFALREALYGLDLIAAELDDTAPRLKPAMEALMTNEPGYWASYYPGAPKEQQIQRHFSYSDRIRYYWAHPIAQKAVGELMARLGDTPLPETLISQHLATAWPEVMAGLTRPTAAALARASVTRMLRTYVAACS